MAVYMDGLAGFKVSFAQKKAVKEGVRKKLRGELLLVFDRK
jgi:hypothetical protein